MVHYGCVDYGVMEQHQGTNNFKIVLVEKSCALLPGVMLSRSFSRHASFLKLLFRNPKVMFAVSKIIIVNIGTGSDLIFFLF